MTFVIFDDEPYFIEQISSSIRLFMDNNCARPYELHAFCDAMALQASPLMAGADIFILDIHTSNNASAGIELAFKIREHNTKAHIVFITSRSEHRQHVISPVIRPSGYIDKPLDEWNLSAVLKDIVASLELGDIPVRFHVGGSRYVNKDDIVYAERIGRKIQLYARQAAFTVNETVSSLRARLGADFILIDRGILINRKHILRVDLKENRVIVTPGKELYISQRRRSAVKSLLEEGEKP